MKLIKRESKVMLVMPRVVDLSTQYGHLRSWLVQMTNQLSVGGHDNINGNI
jgi:hypothetical protein